MMRRTDNVMHGDVHVLVQAGSVHDGVHIERPARAPSPVPRQLPARPRSLIGREAETAGLTAALAEAERAGDLPVLMIEGSGGIGKTALALDWAHRHVEHFPDGQLYADLGGFEASALPAQPRTVLQGFILALGIEPASIPNDLNAAAALYRSLLAGKRVLVVLDNAVDTAQITPLLPGTASSAAVLTSRNRLVGLRAGHVYLLRLGMLTRTSSHVLLTGQLDAGTASSESGAVANIIDQCAGLPLALTIVAARASLNPGFPLAVLSDELRETSEGLDGFDAGEGSMRLNAVFSWSSSRLDAEQARAFRLLGLVPVPEFSQDAAASLLGLSNRRAARLLGEFERRNLLQQPKPSRYLMHDLIRRHARGLAGDTELYHREAAMLRLVNFFLCTAHDADRLLYRHRTPVTTPERLNGVALLRPTDEPAALAWFATEYEQLLAAQRHSERHGWWQQAWQLSRALDTYQHRQALLDDNIHTSRLGVTAARSLADPTAIALAERQLGRALSHAGRLAEAATHLKLALALTKHLNDATGQAHTHHDLARLHSLAGDHAAGLQHSSEALRLYRERGNSIGEAHALNRIARQLVELGDHDRAQTSAEAALARHNQNGNHAGWVATLDNLGHIAQRAGQPNKAVTYYSLALDGCAADTDKHFEAAVAEHLGDAQAAIDDRRAARTALLRAHLLYADQFRDTESRRVLGKLATLGDDAEPVHGPADP
jgi:tetratricopeptide (TPR) repeat protein